MPKYRVTVPFACFVSIEIEADNEDEAKEEAEQEACINAYVGNGGSDMLIGVDGDGESIEAGDTPLDMPPFSIEAELLLDDSE